MEAATTQSQPPGPDGTEGPTTAATATDAGGTGPQGSSSLGHAAQRYAGLDWHVFPLQPKSKQPIAVQGELEHGHLDASADVRTVGEWWGRWPTANIGVALEPSGLVVIDVDPRNGGDLGELQRACDLGSPLVARTGSGGWHLLYTDVGVPLRSKLDHIGLFGIDVKRNGYIVAAPSVHPNGTEYAWNDEEVAVERLPLMVVDLLRSPAVERVPSPKRTAPLSAREQAYVDATVNNVCQRIASAREGERHDTQFAGACQLGELVGSACLERPRAEKRLMLAMTQLYGVAPNRNDVRDMNDGLDRGARNPRDVPDEFEQARKLLQRITESSMPIEIIELYAENNPELLRQFATPALDVEWTAALGHIDDVAGAVALDRAAHLIAAS